MSYSLLNTQLLEKNARNIADTIREYVKNKWREQEIPHGGQDA